MDANITVPDLQSFLDDVRKAGGDATPLARAAYTNSAGIVVSAARVKAPHQTGTLQRSIMAEPPGANSIVVKVNEKYGQFVEYGTGVDGPLGHRIYPRYAKVMAWKGGGGMVFARSTRGMKKRPYFWPAVDESRPLIIDQFNQVADRLVKELAGR